MTPRRLRSILRGAAVGYALGVVIAGLWGAAVNSPLMVGMAGVFAVACVGCMWAISCSYDEEGQ